MACTLLIGGWINQSINTRDEKDRSPQIVGGECLNCAPQTGVRTVTQTQTLEMEIAAADQNTDKTIRYKTVTTDE